MFRTILVPVDGSPHARKALSLACQLLADRQDACLLLLHVPEAAPHDPPMMWGVGSEAAADSRDERERRARQLLDTAAEEARDRGVRHVEPELRFGDPTRTILELADARDVDAILMGSRGLSDLRGLFTGSVSHKVSHAAECSVVTVH
ncbi:universal stress protein [Halomonas sp. ND22Bw]|uniref:Universal stress protein n=1 Tax=Halomonas salina TaxID=42565 RepID=A0ABR4WS49_9GAMM|nr:universal stress protein [Halomonas salina]KGE77552.1 universal stress protein [Halomonas salina]PSJ22089.1 universal stress protein [Halomonas sp. ND22Bw]